ncbi:PREDICTED: uncharacterized protein LOC109584146 [Amphimedon queenslandica]|uniref:Uncharacterized protein n=1 Tax=Amphimedon queenslandica TaxID=400682 RepID=A0A1X7U9L9_AMPQE|nr:PREDICTED: uncharacterized protein LOC109584146 [Amphimedon queenslandica]|eukprot:XP_019855306.1 PREDICTED: uncharacterized protein LOC109584146 [Amphimedon queenslandica]
MDDSSNNQAQSGDQTSRDTIMTLRGISLCVPGVSYDVKSTAAFAKNFQETQHQRKGSVRRSRDQQPAICSPQAESTLPSCPPDEASLSFLSVMEETRRNHPRLHIRILQNAVNTLLEAYPGVLFALDHSKISRNGYNVIPPLEPLFFDDPVYIAVIKRSNIQFILMSIEQILPMLECSQYVKQSFEEICERWSEAKGKALDYYGILKELSLTFQSL